MLEPRAGDSPNCFGCLAPGVDIRFLVFFRAFSTSLFSPSDTLAPAPSETPSRPQPACGDEGERAVGALCTR